MTLGDDFNRLITRLDFKLPPGRSYTLGKGKTRTDEPLFAVLVYRNGDDGLAEINEPEFAHEADTIGECINAAIQHFREPQF